LKNPDTREPRSFKQRKESLPSGIISRRHIDNWRKSGMELSEYLFEIIVSLSEYKIRCQNRRSNRTETSNQVKYATCCLIFFSEPEYCALSLTVDSTHHSHLLAAFLKVVLIDAYCIDPSKKARQVAAHTAPVHVTARGLSKLDHRKPLWSPWPSTLACSCRTPSPRSPRSPRSLLCPTSFYFCLLPYVLIKLLFRSQFYMRPNFVHPALW
jgi:hypothetical protein